jgi:quercetin dioxygenase-like cupin family protein
MTTRDADLQAFFDAARAAFGEFAQDPASRRSLARIFAALERPAATSGQAAVRLPVCAQLTRAAAPDTFAQPALHRLAAAFARLEPRLCWRRREASGPSASANFAGGHANAMVAGPGGLEPRADVWLGVTLLAPHVRYPDHAHPPEETYLVLSEGEFSQGGGAWFRPGVGGSFYNEPGVVHAMRSLEVPLLAFWALCAEPSATPA